MIHRRAVLLVCCVVLAACSADADRGETAPAAGAVQVGAENIVTVARDRIVAGPIISGALRAEREATVRAQLGGSVEQVMVEEGQSVRKGALLGRIEADPLQDAARSAESAVVSAEHQLALARREAERTEQLVSAGALASRDLDVARSNVTAAEAQLADARARLVAARNQLGDAVLRAPIAGVVSDRAVGTGDVVSSGALLFTIIDPSSMRLEASVPSDELSALRVDARVQFSVRGYQQPFEGHIERISPVADPATRQVPILVSIPNTAGTLVAGLFAEGRVVVEEAEGLVVPMNAVNTTGGEPWVLRVTDGRAERVPVILGVVDRRTERVQIASGVEEGDVLLRGAAQGITPGTPVDAGTAR